ncbi:MAG: UPF0149 family protein [Pseudomonadota bacterium]
MNTPENTVNTVLSAEQFIRFEELLTRSKSSGGLNIEEVDGFLTALVCAPRAVAAQVYMPVIFGENTDQKPWGTEEEFKELIDLMAIFHGQKVNRMAAENLAPQLILRPNADGVVTANDWASGFMKYVSLDSSSWLPLLSDLDHRGKLVSIMALAHENDEDPNMRTFEEPVTPELREEMIAALHEALPTIYAFMKQHGGDPTKVNERNYRRAAPKVGRNDPCPCGSGKKAKKCGCGLL